MCEETISINGFTHVCHSLDQVHGGPHGTRVVLSEMVIDGFEWGVDGGQVILNMSQSVAKKVFGISDEQKRPGEIRDYIRQLTDEAQGLDCLFTKIGSAMESGNIEELRSAAKAVEEFKHGSPLFDEAVPF